MTVLDKFVTVLHSSGEKTSSMDALFATRVLDALGASIAGSATSEGRALAEIGELAPLGSNLLDSIARAVGTMRLSEVDDIHIISCTTAGAIVIPVALNFLPLLHSQPRQIVAAIAAGYEAIARIGEATNGPTALYSGRWPTFTAAPVGAAVTLSTLMNLTQEQTKSAIAMSLSFIGGGVGRPLGKTSRWLLIGLAARAGCAAALAAARDHRGDPNIFDKVWINQMLGMEFSHDKLLAPSQPAIIDTCQKPFCGAKQTMAATQAFLRLLADGLDVGGIDRIRVRTPPIYANMISRSPTDRSGRIVSVAYQLALAAHKPEALWDVERSAPDSPELIEAMKLVEVEPADDLAAFYPNAWPAEVEAVMKDGRRLRESVVAADGDPERPLDNVQVVNKFCKLVEPVIGASQANILINAARMAFVDANALAVVSDEFGAIARGEHAVGHD